VCDAFAGSGSTLIACEQLGRICFCLEVEPKYCDVIVERWETYTGKKAKRIPAAVAPVTEEVSPVGG
jgi:DNA modification methylase